MWRSLVVLLFAGRALAAQVANPPPPDKVPLVFAWTPGMEADVFVRVTRLRQTGPRADTTDAWVRHRLVVSPHARGLLVVLDNLDAKEPPPPDLPDGQALSELLQAAAATLPSYVVSREGDFLGLHDLAGNLAAARRLLQLPKLDSALRRNPQARGLIDVMLSETYFTSKAEEDWNALVGAWVGATFEVGETYEREVAEPVPIFPGLRLPFTYTFSLPDRRPCLEDQPAPECVELTMVSRPDPDSMRGALQEILKKLVGGAADQVAFDTLDLENTVTLIADPATLRPYWLDVHRLVSGVAREGGGGPQTVLDDRRRRYEFAYGPRAEMKPFEPRGDIFGAVAGTWGWGRGGPSCGGNPHTILFSANATRW